MFIVNIINNITSVIIIANDIAIVIIILIFNTIVVILIDLCLSWDCQAKAALDSTFLLIIIHF